MIQFTIEMRIARPTANVVAYIVDPAKLSTWQTNTVSVMVEDGGPMRRGARLHEIHRAPDRREIASVVEVADYEPGRLLDLRMIDGPLRSMPGSSLPPTTPAAEQRNSASPHTAAGPAPPASPSRCSAASSGATARRSKPFLKKGRRPAALESTR